MCEPTTIMMIAAAMASKQKEKQAQDRQNKAAEAAHAADTVQLGVQQQEVDAQATQEMSQRAREALIERSHLEVAAGQSGVGGATAQRAVRTADASSGRDISTIESNRASRSRRIQTERESSRARYRGRINQGDRGNSAFISTMADAASNYYSKQS